MPELGVREKVTVLPELQKCLQSPVLPQTPRCQDQKLKETESNKGAERATESTQTQHSCQQLKTHNEDKN